MAPGKCLEYFNMSVFVLFFFCCFFFVLFFGFFFVFFNKQQFFAIAVCLLYPDCNKPCLQSLNLDDVD